VKNSNDKLVRLKTMLAKLDALADPRVDVNEWRRRREAAEARIVELTLAQKEGRLLDAERVRQAVCDMIIAARSKLLVIGAELADKLAAISDPVRCRELIDERIHAALDELAEYPPKPAEKPGRRRKPAKEPL